MIWILELAAHCWLAMTHWWQVEHNCYKKAEQLLKLSPWCTGKERALLSKYGGNNN